MSQFEYLSVLVSIIVGLGLSHLLSSAARIIQLRHRARLYGPTLSWMGSLLLIQIQIWWVAFERREAAEWNFFAFFFYLLIPISVYVLSYLVVPDLDRVESADFRASYYANRTWFFGILGVTLLVSLTEEYLRDGGIVGDADAWFRAGFLLLAGAGMWIRHETFHVATAALFPVFLCAYVFTLFLQLA